jgi:hypothetical protein
VIVMKQNKVISLPVIYITSMAYAKYYAYMQIAVGEISGLGEVEKYGDRDFLITDLILFDQETTNAHTELETKSLASFLFQAIDENRDLGKIKLWWHSHVNMPVFWSITDDTTVDALYNSQWMISVVGNKRAEFKTRLDVFKPIRLTVDDLKLEIVEVDDKINFEGLRREVKKKVHYKPPVKVVNKDSKVRKNVPTNQPS